MWTLVQCRTDCEEDFTQLKKAFSTLLMLSTGAVSTVLVREVGSNQSSVYFISKVLPGPELGYYKIEKVALPLLVASRKLLQKHICTHFQGTHISLNS
jgi:hypothetical protein